MNLEYFPHFIRKNYPETSGITNKEINEIGKAFKKYLENKFRDNLDKLIPIWNIDAKTIIMNEVNKKPFLVNGYHPALIIHFGEYLKKEAEKYKSKH